MADSKTHGGKRTGAGRPKSVDHPSRQTVYLDQRHMHLIANWQDVNNCTFSAALRQILDDAIQNTLTPMS